MKAIIFVLLAFIAYASAHICRAEGDPHYRTFGGKPFNFYSSGEYVLFKRKGFTCQTRLRQSNKHWRGKSLNSGVACKYRGVHFEINVDTSVKAYLNYKKFSGAKTIRGVRALFKGRNFSFKANQMELRGNYNRIGSGNLKNYLNLYVYSHKSGASGLCAGQKTKARRSLFHHGKAPRYHKGKRRHLNKNWLKIAAGICRRHFRVGSFSYRSCVYDIASEKRKRIGRQYARFSRVVKGKFKKVCNAHHCHYYKRVTHVRHIHYTRHHWTKHRIVDHRRRSVARRRASYHRSSMSKISRKRNAHINKVHSTANKHISGIRRSIYLINRQYNKKVRSSSIKKQRQINKALRSYQTTIKKMNVWRQKVRVHANKKRSQVIRKWNVWRQKTVQKANKKVSKRISAINRWRSSRYIYANKHHSRVVSSKRKWYQAKVAFANRLHRSTLRRLRSIRKYKLKQLNCRLSAIHMRRKEEVSQLRDDYNHQIKQHAAAYRRHLRTSRTATRIVRRKHTTHHRRRVVTHKWKLFHKHK
eukprot:gene11169-3990_t